MSVHQAIIASNSNIGLATDPGGGQGSIPNQTPGLWRKKFAGVAGDNPQWYGNNVGLITSGYPATSLLGLDGADGSGTFSLQFLGYFCPTASGTYRFRTTSDDGSWLWIGTPATDSTTQNANVDNGGAHGQSAAIGKQVKLTAGVFYPIRIDMWDSSGNWFLTTEFSSDSGLTWFNDFSGQVFFNSSTNGF